MCDTQGALITIGAILSLTTGLGYLFERKDKTLKALLFAMMINGLLLIILALVSPDLCTNNTESSIPCCWTAW